MTDTKTEPPSPMLSASQLARSPSSARSARRTSATCCIASATAATRSSRSSRARSRSSTPPGNEIVRHGPSKLPRRAEPPVRADGVRHGGRHAAAALHRRRPRRAAIAAVRGRAAQRPRALDLHRAARGAAARPGHRPGDRRPALVRRRRMRMLDFARSNRLPFTWRDPSTDDPRRRSSPGSTRRACRSCGCRAAPSCAARRPARSRARSGSAASSRRGRRSTCSWSAPGPPASAPPSTALPRGSTRSSSTAPRSAGRRVRRGGSRTTSASRPGSAEPS